MIDSVKPRETKDVIHKKKDKVERCYFDVEYEKTTDHESYLYPFATEQTQSTGISDTQTMVTSTNLDEMEDDKDADMNFEFAIQ